MIGNENQNESTKKVSVASILSLSPVGKMTEESIEAWEALPDEVKKDPSLQAFKVKYDELMAGKKGRKLERNLSYDPLEDNDTDNCKAGTSNAKKHHGAHNHQQHQAPSHPNTQNKYVANAKVALLLACWIAFTFFLMSNDEKELEFRKLSIPEGLKRSYTLHELPVNNRIKLIFEGAFQADFFDEASDDQLSFYLSLDSPNGESRNVSEIFKLAIANASQIDKLDEIQRIKKIKFADDDFKAIKDHKSQFTLNLVTNIPTSFAINLAYDHAALNETLGIILAAIVLLGLYVLIVFELVHRTIAAVIAAFSALGILAAMNDKPTMEVIISWIDAETLLLLFGMMIIVAILAQTGLFDYLAVYAFKITKGHVWPLIICLCFFTAILSSVLDNVTTILLMTPVTIRLCEVMEFNPVPVLMFSVIYSNIGGTLTPVGDPPNVIITSNSFISKSGITFMNFTLHMLIPVVLVMIQTFFQLRLTFRKMSSLTVDDPKGVKDLRHEIKVWQKAVANVAACSKDEDLMLKSLMRKVERLESELENKLISDEVPKDKYKETLTDLQSKYGIRDKPLLIKSCITLVFVISFFFLHSFPEIQKLSLGWVALLGGLLLLIMFDSEDLDAIMAHIEWSTLLFFAALFILMEALTELGLIVWIGQQTENVIMSVDEDMQLAVAILIILWVSALASAFVDNIPLTTMMIKIVIELSQNQELNLPLQPLVWSLALGACLGGNGTLIGASANVVCAGVAEQHGYKFTFNEFFKVGFPIMIGNIIVATGYLMVAHVALSWH